MRKRIAVLVSGSGSNLQALIDAIANNLLNAEIVAVISDNMDAYALVRARENGIVAIFLPKRDIAEHLLVKLQQLQPDFIVLAGFLSILPEKIIVAFRNKIINIHPSLIPLYCGKGFYGQKVHEAVLAKRETLSGATVHYVDEGVDTGTIIMQRTVRVCPCDTVASLQQRVLRVEHEILVETLQGLCSQGRSDDAADIVNS